MNHALRLLLPGERIVSSQTGCSKSGKILQGAITRRKTCDAPEHRTAGRYFHPRQGGRLSRLCPCYGQTRLLKKATPKPFRAGNYSPESETDDPRRNSTTQGSRAQNVVAEQMRSCS